MNKDASLYTLPPQNLEAENSLLSAILIDNDVLLDVVDIVSPQDFYRSAHQKIFTAVIDLFSKNEPVDLITLSNILKEKNQLKDIGGSTFLAKLFGTIPLAINAPHYAKIVRDKASLRRLIEKSNSILKKCFEERGDVEETIDFAENAIFEVTQNKLNPSFFPIKKLVDKNITALEELQGNKALITGIPTGFSRLDSLTSGFQKSDLIILAARPSMGKTALFQRVWATIHISMYS